MNNINVVDSFKMRDSKSPIKGVVVLKDNNGKIIFKKNNLVVLDGRNIVFSLFENALKGEAGTKYDLFVQIGTGTSITENTTNLDSITTAIEEFFIDTSSNGVGMVQFNQGSNDGTDPHIIIPITITGSGLTAFNMSEIMLVLKSGKDGTNNTYAESKLFSRLVFDPLPLTSSNSYTINYYLYF